MVGELHGDHVSGREPKRRKIGSGYACFTGVTSDADVGHGGLELFLAGRVAVSRVSDVDVLDILNGPPGDDTSGQGVVNAVTLLEALARADPGGQSIRATVGREEGGSY